jgi:hypothetical protein
VLEQIVREPSLLGRQKLMDELAPLYEDMIDEFTDWSKKYEDAKWSQGMNVHRKIPTGKTELKNRLLTEAARLKSRYPKEGDDPISHRIFRRRKAKSPSARTIRRWMSEG